MLNYDTVATEAPADPMESSRAGMSLQNRGKVWTFAFLNNSCPSNEIMCETNVKCSIGVKEIKYLNYS